MVFVSDSFLPRTASALIVGIAVFQFVLGFFLSQWGMMMSLALGAACLLAALACLTYRHEVHIDQENDVLEQYRSILFFDRNRSFLFSSFSSVGVAAVSTKGIRPVQLAFFVELRGPSRIVLPGIYSGLGLAQTRAATIAKELELSVESRIRRILLA